MTTDGKPVIMGEDFHMDTWKTLRRRTPHRASVVDPAPRWEWVPVVEPHIAERVWPSNEALDRTGLAFRAAALRVERARLLRVLVERYVLRGAA